MEISNKNKSIEYKKRTDKHTHKSAIKFTEKRRNKWRKITQNRNKEKK